MHLSCETNDLDKDERCDSGSLLCRSYTVAKGAANHATRFQMRRASMKGRSDRAKALIREMEQARGYIYPHHRYLADADPRFLEAYNRLVGVALLHRGYEDGEHALTAKYRELVVCGILAHRGVPINMLVEHVRRAMRFGATTAELLDTFEAAMVPGGAPTLLNGINALIAVNRPRASKGKASTA